MAVPKYVCVPWLARLLRSVVVTRLVFGRRKAEGGRGCEEWVSIFSSLLPEASLTASLILRWVWNLDDSKLTTKTRVCCSSKPPYKRYVKGG